MISGDIGCYTLAAGKPYSAMDSTVCMGASISLGHGAQKAFQAQGDTRRVVTVLGDSTFSIQESTPLSTPYIMEAIR